ncbi:hypothetical protein [Phormidium sp. CCY1219]|uniref:hypothetical protein n=1 Tax=Phormidium sp. CCY1219 TaxID=2886104 RepID=UPI002D1EBB55|nr:hypothetical protein [Phormidium sp. CCY1219]MEB3828784.1 hypothetical protein [Phormidium sp. CCY1219]
MNWHGSSSVKRKGGRTPGDSRPLPALFTPVAIAIAECLGKYHMSVAIAIASSAPYIGDSTDIEF